MLQLSEKIFEYLLKSPKSPARLIAREIDENKSIVNKYLYANEHKLFLREGSSPPLWSCVTDGSPKIDSRVY